MKTLRASSSAICRLLLILALLAFLTTAPAKAFADPQPEPQKSAEPAKDASQPAPNSVAGELAEETREAAGEDAEENANLKHAKPIRWLAGKIDWSVHGT